MQTEGNPFQVLRTKGGERRGRGDVGKARGAHRPCGRCLGLPRLVPLHTRGVRRKKPCCPGPYVPQAER